MRPAHEKAVEEAKTAARQLDVPLTVLDARADFEAHVAAPFCASYCAGRTPNPYLLCVDNLAVNNFPNSGLNFIHFLHPQHSIIGFQSFGHIFLLGNLLRQHE